MLQSRHLFTLPALPSPCSTWPALVGSVGVLALDDAALGGPDVADGVLGDLRAPVGESKSLLVSVGSCITPSLSESCSVSIASIYDVLDPLLELDDT